MKKNIFLLSYPRSGNTFTRYILEYLTGMGSYGYMSNYHKKLLKNRFWKPKKSEMYSEYIYDGIERPILNRDSDSEYKIIKRHGNFADDILEMNNLNVEDNFFILLVRNPIEVAVRHDLSGQAAFAPAIVERCVSIHDSVDISSCIWNCEHHTFFKNLKGFDNFNGEKKIIFYEDLIQKPEVFIKELCTFLNLNEVELLNEFMSKFAHHKQKAIEYYFGNSKTMRTDTEIKKIDRWSKDVPTLIKTKFWNNFDNNCKIISEDLLHVFNRYKI